METRLVFDIAPSKKYWSGFYDISLKNAGGSPAYNITCLFNPDLPFAENSTLSSLRIFKNLDHLIHGDEITFYFETASKFLDNDSFPKQTVVIMNFEDAQGKLLSDTSKVDLERYEGIGFIESKSIDNIVSELSKIERTLSWIRRNGLVFKTPADLQSERDRHKLEINKQEGRTE
jgi:hypothetical protein